MNAEQTDAVFAALGSGTRRALIGLMADGGEVAVHDLAEQFKLSRPSISEHLKVLKDAGLVAERKDGRQRLYRVEYQRLLSAREWFDSYEEFWRRKMGGLRQVLDEEAGNGR